MSVFWLSASLAIIATVAYHVFQKSIPAGAHPMVSVTVTFASALVASLIILPFLRLEGNLLQEVRKLNWASVALGISIIGVEIGFLLFYRSGWEISIGPVFCNVAIALLLVPVGLLLYRERLNPANCLGIVLALVGTYLMTRR